MGEGKHSVALALGFRLLVAAVSALESSRVLSAPLLPPPEVGQHGESQLALRISLRPGHLGADKSPITVVSGQ